MLQLSQKPKPVILLILDGWGLAPPSPGNAISQANCANFNSFWFSYPHTILKTSGPAVGLPEGHVGNSEVGHLNLGAGRIVLQDLLRINMAIADGTFFENEAFIKAIEHIAASGSKIHLMGLVGPGSVHSQVDHLHTLLKLLAQERVPAERVKLQLFTDGRDSPPTSAQSYLASLLQNLKKENLGSIASVSGRWWAMDRDNRWDRTQKAYLAQLGRGPNFAKDVLAAIDQSYAAGVTDEFIVPTTLVDNEEKPVGPIEPGDSVIFFNYRPDRARQLTKAFVLDSLGDIKTTSGEVVKTFERGPKIANLYFVTLTQYETGLPAEVAFKPQAVTMPLARVFSEANLRQLHIAETEKYAHVTYFFNGGQEQPYIGEKRILVNSPKVASYDQTPEMATPEITKRLIAQNSTNSYDFMVVNFANADMVAHTGNLQATVRGIQTIDYCLGLVARATLAIGGGVIVTADHGNAEVMINSQTAQIDTEHNDSPAPGIFIFNDLRGKNLQLRQGILADVAPTILNLMKIPKPSQMTGRNLLE